MKKLIFLIALIAPFFVVAQTQLTLTNGQKFDCQIAGVWGTKLAFEKFIPILGNDKVDVRHIVMIAGEISESTKKSILKKNKAIVFEDEIQEIDSVAIPANTAAIAVGTTGTEYLPQDDSFSPAIELTAGDYIKESAWLRLSAFSITSVTGIAVLAGAFKDNPDTQKTVAIVAGAASLILYIAGESLQIKAGKLMNEQITITPSSQGIGMAINF